jgi:hypothetical protein
MSQKQWRSCQTDQESKVPLVDVRLIQQRLREAEAMEKASQS